MSGVAGDLAAYETRAAVEFTPRGGLPNFFARAQEGEGLRIGYLGGSITAQSGWRVTSREWLQRKFPKARFEEINAAIGGTGSDLGVFRLEFDVLRHRPDLLFVEFAVNDDNAEPGCIRRAMEGIVRQTWRGRPECDICFVYTLTCRHTQTLQKGYCTRSQAVMETVADHYDIPSINLGLEVAALEKSGALLMKSEDAHLERVSGNELNLQADLPRDAQGRIIFSKDGVHPYLDTGHALYMAVIARSLGQLPLQGKSGAHVPVPPLDPANWETAKMVALERAGVLTGAEQLNADNNPLCKQFCTRLPGLWLLKPGAEFRFRFRGSKVMIYDLVGPDCGKLEVTLDGQVSTPLRMDAYCTYNRLAPLPIGEPLEEGKHSVAIRVLPDAVDKRTILFEHNRADFDRNPQRYREQNWYAGAVLLVGEILPS